MAPRIVDRKARRETLVEAAVKVFSARGFQGTAMEDVAAAAGVGKGTLYHYFQNKEDLFYACSEWYQQLSLNEAMAAMATDQDAEQRLRTLARVAVASAQKYIEFFPMTLEVWAAASSGAARERFSRSLESIYAAFRQAIEAILRQGQQEGTFRADLDVPGIAVILTGAADGALLQYWFNQNMDIQGYLENFIDLLIRGMRP